MTAATGIALHAAHVPRSEGFAKRFVLTTSQLWEGCQ
jgi:hypothetical protein